MMLLFAPHSISAEKFTAPISGLRSLLVVPDADADAAGTRGGCVVTRATVDAHGCGHRDDVVKARRDDGTSLGHGGEDGETAKAEEGDEKNEEDDNMEVNLQEREEEDELDGFWVSYGRRCPRRRLPPPIPSLVARGALRRTRTDDARLVIRIVPVVRPECIRARRRRDRLVVEHEDDSPVTPLPPLCEPMTAASEDGIRIDVAHQADDDDAAAPPAREGVRDVEDAVAAPAETLPVPVPPPRVPSVGCFEEVFKLGSIGSSSLHQMPSLRMVH